MCTKIVVTKLIYSFCSDVIFMIPLQYSFNRIVMDSSCVSRYCGATWYAMKYENRKEHMSRKELPRLDRRVIRSLGDEVRVVPMELMVAMLRRERMVTHDFAKTSFLGPRMNNLQVVLLREMCRSWSPCLDRVLLQSTKSR